VGMWEARVLCELSKLLWKSFCDLISVSAERPNLRIVPASPLSWTVLRATASAPSSWSAQTALRATLWCRKSSLANFPRSVLVS